MAQHEDGVPFNGMVFLLISVRIRELVIRDDDRLIGGISSDTDLETSLQRGLSLLLCHVTLKVIVFSKVTSRYRNKRNAVLLC